MCFRAEKMTATVQKTRHVCSPERLGFLPIAIETLVPSNSLPFDLFLLTDEASTPVLYREHRLPFDPEDLSRLTEQAITTLYIRISDHRAYRNYLDNTVLRNSELPATQRFKILQVANRAIFQLAFHSRKPDMLVKFAAEYGDELTAVVCDENLVLSDLLPLMTHDYYTYTHATNVCTLSLMIACTLGMRPADGLVGLASAALLHDIGKRRIAPAILNQRTPLNRQQREMIRQHPKWGFQELCLRQDIISDQLMVVYQHHERWNGRGYPVGLVGKEIHPWARICAVADVYDAMSSARPYRDALPLGDVWRRLRKGANRDFDDEIIKCLRSSVGPRG